MSGTRKTKAQLLAELTRLRQRLASLEAPPTVPPMPAESPRTSGHFFQASFDALSAHIAILDASGTIVTVNQAWRRFAAANGLPEAAAGGGTNYLRVCDTATDLGAAEAVTMGQGLRQVLGGQREEFSLEYPCHSPTTQRWFVARVSRFHSPTGLYLVVAHEDVTARRLAEDTLRASEHRFRAIFAQRHQLAGILSPGGILLEVNQRALEFIGRQSRDVLGRPFWETPWWTHDATLQQRLRAAINDAAQGRGSQFEATHPRPDGTLAHVDFALRPIHNVMGTVVSLVAESQDTSERKQAEAALRESEARYRFLAEAVPGMVWTTRPDGTSDYVNLHWRQYTGQPLEEAVGFGWTEVLHPEDRQRCLAGWRRAVETGEPYEGEARYRRYDGVYRWFLERALPMRAETGQISSWFGISIEIDDKKHAEALLQQANSELERRVQERTAALQAANEDVRRFAYIVSHDLRAPLINLKGFAGELRGAHATLATALEAAWPHVGTQQAIVIRHVLEQEIPEALGFIDTAVTRMDSLVRAVLQLSRLGRRELVIERIAMQPLVEEVLRTLAHQIAQRQVRVLIEPLPDVDADRTAMSQILGNLLANAVAYLEADRPGELRVSAERHPAMTVFHVSDNGRGIAAADLSRVFEPFRRVGRQDGPGEGMGLAYVRALVQRHGGEITCQSTLRVGTTFTFTIADIIANAPQRVAT